MISWLGVVRTGFIAGVIGLGLGVIAPVAATDMAEKEPQQKGFRVAVTQVPVFTLASALAYGSPVETLLLEKDGEGRWRIPDNLTVLFWSGTALEPELGKQLAQSDQASVALLDAAGIQQLAKRTPADWKAPAEDEDPHSESVGKGYGMVQTIRPEGVIDTNYWLDPLNAMAALETIKTVFQGVDERNHWGYQGNADQIVEALREQDMQVSKLLYDVSNQPFVVLNDEFQYLEQRYRLITVPAGGSARDIVDKAKARGAKCVVATEPMGQQLESALDQAGLNRVVLDPAGRRMPRTTGAYFKWYRDMITGLNGCMTP